MSLEAANNQPKNSGFIHKWDKTVRDCVIALGANLGDTKTTLNKAVEQIGLLPGVSVAAVSSMISSEPAYRRDQPVFTNAVMLVQLEPELAPLKLLHWLQLIELWHGRDRSGQAVINGPRTLDIDIIDIEGYVSDEPELLLPHPLALERGFVVEPLLEIAPGYVLANGIAVAAAQVAAVGAVEVATDVMLGTGTAAATEVAAEVAAECAAEVTEQVAAETATEVATVVTVSATAGIAASRNAPQGVSRAESACGRLSLCATPIGNLGDITQRVVRTLSEADLVLAEDTRVARRLLSHLNLRPSLQRCDENIIRSRAPEIVERLQCGQKITYLSDAGTPGICDPGIALVAAAREAGISVDVLPGASAVLTAVVSAGFEFSGFYFGGFLPRKNGQRRQALEALAALAAALVFYESPHRTIDSLEAIAEVFPERQVAVCRELTKLHEEVLQGSAKSLAQQLRQRAQGVRNARGAHGTQGARGTQGTQLVRGAQEPHFTQGAVALDTPSVSGTSDECDVSGTQIERASQKTQSESGNKLLKGEIVLVIAPPPAKPPRQHRDKYSNNGDLAKTGATPKR